MNMTPLYKRNAEYAREHGELEIYRSSMKANIACKEAIEAAIRGHFNGMHLDKAAIHDVIEAYGLELTCYVVTPYSKKPGTGVSLTITRNGQGSLRLREPVDLMMTGASSFWWIAILPFSMDLSMNCGGNTLSRKLPDRISPLYIHR